MQCEDASPSTARSRAGVADLREQGANVTRQAVVVVGGAAEPEVEQGFGHVRNRVPGCFRRWLVRISGGVIRLLKDPPAQIEKNILMPIQNSGCTA